MTAPIQTARFVCKAERVRELTDTGMMPERPSVLERLKGYRTQLDQKSAPTRQKTKDRQKAR